ncbi:MAG: metalloprotease TldD [Aestuariivita sp.]|nr:metalloprotease TldD [Aestuariivita sp.]
MSLHSFQPFDTAINQNDAIRILKNATERADDGELFLERRQSESLVFEEQRLKTASFNTSEGFGLRAVQGEVTGYAHSNDISSVNMLRAAETVRFAMQKGGGIWANSPTKTDKKCYSSKDPTLGIALCQKIETLRSIDDYLRGLDPRVIQVSASLGTTLQEVIILRPEGLKLSDTRPMARLNISVIVEHNGRRESGGTGGGGRVNLEGIIATSNWQAKAREALRIALVNLEADAAPAGVMDVVLGPGWPGVLLHEAVGHGLEGDFNRKGTSAFAGLMGQRVAARGVHVVDDGTLPNRRGSIMIDDEGTPSAYNLLIEDGILVRYMQDRQSARLMNVSSTGNCRRQSFAHAPMPRMTNTYMLNGTSDPKDLVAELKNGIYAVGFGGGQVDITNGKFVFSCTEAYRVTNGKIGKQIKGATLIGDGATALQQIRGLGNDMALDPGIGNCGKQGQWVPVGVGQPSVLIGGLTVGGAKV